jgi:hypothetical protein
METKYCTVELCFPRIGCDHDPPVTIDVVIAVPSLSENPAGTLQIRDAADKSMMHCQAQLLGRRSLCRHRARVVFQALSLSHKPFDCMTLHDDGV